MDVAGINILVNVANEGLKKKFQEIETGLKSGKAEAKKYEKSVSSVFSTTKLALLGTAALGVYLGKSLGSSFNKAIANANKLYLSQGALFKITEQEVKQSYEYQRSLKQLNVVMSNIQTRIALNLLPTIQAVTYSFSEWLLANKELIAEGITKVVSFCIKTVQVVTNVIKAVNLVIESTIGWKTALIALAAAFAFLSKALLRSPLAPIVLLLTGLGILIDDLMTYKAGGDSFFGGAFWEKVIGYLNTFWSIIKQVYDFVSKLIIHLINVFKVAYNEITEIFTNLTNAIVNIYNKIKNLYINLFQGIRDGFNQLVDNLLAIWNKIKGGFNAVLNLVGLVSNKKEDVINSNAPASTFQGIATTPQAQVVNQGSVNNVITINSTNIEKTAEEVGDMFQRQLEEAHYNAKDVFNN